jgi:hypothetical protein
MESQAEASGGLRSELRGDAQTLTDAATQRLHTEVDARKGGAVSQVKSVSTAIGSAANELGADAPTWLRSALEKASQTIQKVADSVEQKDSRQLSQDLQQVARSNPGTFLAVSALAGFAAARVLQAGTGSSTRSQVQPYGTDESFGSSEGSAMNFTVLPDPYVSEGATL